MSPISSQSLNGLGLTPIGLGLRLTPFGLTSFGLTPIWVIKILDYPLLVGLIVQGVVQMNGGGPFQIKNFKEYF